MAAPHPHDTDLSAFHGYANFANWAAHGSFTKVKTLANAIHGKVILHRWTKPNGMEQDVVVKRMPRGSVLQNQGKWTNESWSHRNPRSMHCPHPEDALTEIGVLSYLRQQEDLPLFLLRMMGSFTDGSNVLLVTEFIQDGEVFQQVQDRHLDNSEGALRQLMWQLLHAVRYLHHHDIGHRDISLENVLIAMPAEGRPPSLRLMDFGQAVRTRSRCRNVALRYFRTVGKPYYRSPEAYVPRSETVRVIAPAAAAAGDVMFLDNLGPTGAPDGYSCEVRLPADVRPGEPCDAEVWGYEVPPLDVFALGVCLFILAWRIPPWGLALRSDGTFQYIQAYGIQQLLTTWRLPLLSAEAMALLTDMMAANPQRRPSAEDCLASEWLRPLAEAQVPVHAVEDDVVDPAVAAIARMEIAADRRMVNWGDTWADDLRTAVREIAGTGYRITDAHGQQRIERAGQPGELEEVPLPSAFPLCVSVN